MTEKRKILVVDDNKSTLRVIKAILEQEGYDIYTAASDETAIETIKNETIQICLMDLKMPGVGGVELFKKLKAINNNITVVIMTAYGTVESAVTAMKIGVENYLQKPLNFEELKVIIARLFEKIELREDVAILKGQRGGKDIFENMIGRSKKMREIFARISNIAKSESTVLISGESGTGKEMAARAIHNLSKRNDQKMISINLAAIPEGLQESELFGFEKGAFTGAYTSRKGKFEIADKGTMFLDEIGNTNYKVQAKLLRVIEEKKVEPLGGNKSMQVDVRLISATNSDLKADVEKGTFREDLYFRLNVIRLEMPPLRERKADIPILSNFFLKELCLKNSIEEKSISDAGMESLMEYNWPGNIRELKNVIEEAVVVSNGKIIEPENLNMSYFRGRDSAGMHQPNEEMPLRELEKKTIINALIKTKGNQTRAARLLGISRKIIMTKIEKHKIFNIVPVRTRRAKKS